MKTYWDTSGLINAAISGAVLQRLTAGEHTTRTHALAEFYGIFTGVASAGNDMVRLTG